jgi:hypothetical protein
LGVVRSASWSHATLKLLRIDVMEPAEQRARFTRMIAAEKENE